MYYLEDKHPKKEYTCYIRVKSATPYIGVWKSTDLIDVYDFIREIEKRHSRSGNHFYIDNDFYKNHYNNNEYAYYYRFMERSVNDWHQLKLKNNIIKIAQ